MIDDESFPHIPDRSIFADHEHLGAGMVPASQAVSSLPLGAMRHGPDVHGFDDRNRTLLPVCLAEPGTGAIATLREFHELPRTLLVP
jgi:hypothetical protein